jgi:murein DD-endopeptidase MepM/ murein hydrolase activator NlpD
MESSKLPPYPICRRCLVLALVTFLAPFIAIAENSPAAANQTKSRASATQSWMIRRQPEQLVNGNPLVIEVKPPVRLKALSAKWLDHEVLFSYDSATKNWYGIAGVSLETHPGVYTLELKGTTAKPAEVSFSQNIRVQAARYPSIAVTVAKKFTEPSKEQLERIHQDKTVKQDVFQHTDPEREWSGRFRPPVEVPVSDVFGTRRTFNGKVQSVHQGLDYAAPNGTPVAAVNAGTVLLAEPLYFEGNCVVLDHGQGLLTLYLHLSEIKVKQGDRIARGQEIGLSGDTGRATGPHLHLAVRWQGIYLNPATLLSLKLP